MRTIEKENKITFFTLADAPIDTLDTLLIRSDTCNVALLAMEK